MPLVETEIDGERIEVERDRWALEVAREMGISIPTLCHHPAVEPYGACRLCVVEVTRGRWTWLTTSCDLPVREGLSIRTGTPAVIAARKMALELLWAQAPGADEVRTLAVELGVEKPRFAPRNKDEKCILCGLCVRVCREVVGEAAIGFSSRGAGRRVGAPFDEAADACIGCGSCVAVCPTGAVVGSYEQRLLRMKTWHTDLELAACASCGRPFAAKRLLERLRSRAADLEEALSLCPRCRSAETGAKLARALAMSASEDASPRQGLTITSKE